MVIDPTNYRIAVRQAEAAVQQAQASVQNVDAQMTVQQAQVSANQAQLDQAQAVPVQPYLNPPVCSSTPLVDPLGTSSEARERAVRARAARAAVRFRRASLQR